MEKIYVATWETTNGTVPAFDTCIKITTNKEEAIEAAKTAWYYTTKNERKNRRINVGEYDQLEEADKGDTLEDMIDWDGGCQTVYEIEEEEEEEADEDEDEA